LIYFVRRQDDRGLIKIGVSVRLSRRIKQPDFQQYFDSPAELVVLGVMDGGYADESVLHKKFGFARVIGEWFDPYDELLAFIEAETWPWDGTDEVPDATLVIKCRHPYKEWVVALARKHRTTPSQIIDRALVAFAEADGFDPPPER
jgi:hypothetical protein